MHGLVEGRGPRGELGQDHVDTAYDVLDKICRAPERPVSASMRMPVTGTY